MINIKSFAKVNLSLDVGSVMENGMHPVDMIMQQTTLSDDIMIDMREDQCAAREEQRDTLEAVMNLPKGFSLFLKTNSHEIPLDSSNIVYRAAELMIDEYHNAAPENFIKDSKKTICVYIDKHIPVAAGLAGGSGNAAAVIHGLNVLWHLGLHISDLCEIGKKVGSDVPFCIMGQAKENFRLPDKVRRDELAVSCARARGTGTDLMPIHPLRTYLVIAKPDLNVSTAEVYREIDSCKIERRPDNDALEEAINGQSIEKAVSEMINVLENYTLKAYPKVTELKTLMKEKMTDARHIMMSGSGPSIFAIFDDELAAIEGLKSIRACGYEAHICKTK